MNYQLYNMESESSDDAESEEEEIALLYASQYRKKRRNRQLWIKNHICYRDTKGEFHSLVPDLDDETFRRYCRLTRPQFYELHEIIKDDIRKQDTTFRRPIGTEERLIVCLRQALHFILLLYIYSEKHKNIAYTITYRHLPLLVLQGMSLPPPVPQQK